MKRTYIVLPIVALALIGGGMVAGYASLAGAQMPTHSMATRPAWEPHVGGVITAIKGSTITVTAHEKLGGGTYTIDASDATFTQDGAAVTLAQFAVGDMIRVEGEIDGSSVEATEISSGGRGMGRMGGHGGMRAHAVMGTVTAVDGSTVTVTGRNGVNYTVEAGDAAIEKRVTGSLSDIKVGDTIGVRGDVSGTRVTAKTIVDDIPMFGQQ